MKFYFVLVSVFCAALPLAAYQAGQANRTNFGQAQPSQQGYRSFSNYNNNRPWSEGVQTEVVQTHNVQISLVGNDTPAKPEAPKAAPVAKKQAAAAAAQPKPAAPTQASTAPAAQAVTAPQPAQAPADAAAMMQQVQGMMNMVNNMTGQSGMPAGMPDMSALMGGAAAPKAAPGVKK